MTWWCWLWIVVVWLATIVRPIIISNDTACNYAKCYCVDELRQVPQPY
jgi:hypothetical protein